MTSRKLTSVLKSGALALAVVFSLGARGEICGYFFDSSAAAFDYHFPDNREDDIAAMLLELGPPRAATGPSNSAGRHIAVLLTEGAARDEQDLDGDTAPGDDTSRMMRAAFNSPVYWSFQRAMREGEETGTFRMLRAYDLASGEPMWSIPQPVQSELTIEGDLAVFQSRQSVVGHDLVDGRELWRIDVELGWSFLGASVFGDTAVVTIGVGGEEIGSYGFGELIAIDARTGRQRWTVPSGGGVLGRTAAHNDLLFAPWERQKIAVLRLKDGTEIARVRTEDFTQPLDYVRAGPAGVYFGSNAQPDALSTLVRFDIAAAAGTPEDANHWVPRLEPVPGDPGFIRDAYAHPIGAATAAEKIRFHWQPAVDPARPIAMSDGLYYLHYWKFIIAFDSDTHQVRWTHISRNDIVSTSAVSGGIIGVDTDGRMFFIDAASGKETWHQDIGFRVLTAAFDANGMRPPGGGGEPADAFESLKNLLWDKDNRMLPIRSYAAFLMADFPAPEVTRDLLAIYSDAQIPRALRDTVVLALKRRTTGAQYLVDALHMRYDYLEQTQGPPMSVVVPALINMEERAAVPGLLSHLMNHETPTEDLREIALAIRELGDPSVIGTLSQFMVLYHADSSFIGHEDALAVTAEAMLAHGGQAGEQLVAGLRDDPQTLPALQTMLRDILDPEAAAKAAAATAAAEKVRAKAEATARAEDAVARAEAERLARPPLLTPDQISDAIATNQQYLRPCVQQALGLMPNLQQIRMRFMITGETGKASGLQILPMGVPGLQECLASGLDSIDFPKFKNLRQPATYVISIRGQEHPPGYQAPPPGQPPATYDPDAFGGPGGFQQPPQQEQQPARPPSYDPDAF